MIEQDKVVEPEKIACEVCFKEIPISEATSVRATDYIMYYCGLDCYDKWKKQQEERGAERRGGSERRKGAERRRGSNKNGTPNP